MENEEYKGIDRSSAVRPEILGSLHQLFLRELSEAYAMEKMLSSSLPALAALATNEMLAVLIRKQHTSATVQLKKLEHLFYMIGEKRREGESVGIAHLLQKASQTRVAFDCDLVVDVAVIGCLLRIDHAGIAQYGTLCSLAKTLGKSDVTADLHEMLVNKKGGNETLSEIIENLEVEMLQNYSE